MLVWLALVSTPEKTRWLPQAEREHILAGRDAGIPPPSHAGIGYLGLIRCPATGCLVYTVYLYMSWLPNYLQTARHVSMLSSGFYTAIPFLAASAVNIAANWAGDRLLTADAVRRGNRRCLVALCLLLTSVGLAPLRLIAGGGTCPGDDRGVFCQCQAGRQRCPG